MNYILGFIIGMCIAAAILFCAVVYLNTPPADDVATFGAVGTPYDPNLWGAE